MHKGVMSIPLFHEGFKSSQVTISLPKGGPVCIVTMAF